MLDKRFEVSELVGRVAPERYVGEGEGGPSSGWWDVGTGVAPGTLGWRPRQSMVGGRAMHWHAGRLDSKTRFHRAGQVGR